jgi:hypothetical protein
MKHSIDNTITKEVALQLGRQKRRRLQDVLQRYLEVNQLESYPHLVISSRPGIGKTHSALEILTRSEVPHYMISGSTSMFAFGIALAVIQYENPAFVSVNILVDDCDSLFNDVTSLNTMKNVLNVGGTFRYEKSMSTQRNFLSELQKLAIDHFSADGRMGFTVPTHNLRFIFTSNIKLPTENDVYRETQKGKSKGILMSHQNAIRSRCRCLDITLSDVENWGWIADVLKTTQCITSKGVTDEQIDEILEFFWEKWEKLNEHSIRTAEKMAESIIANPNPAIYKAQWEIDFLM